VSGGCGLAVAVVVSCAGLSPDVLLSTCRPLLESGDHAKVIFESKRAYTELRHLGIQLAGRARAVRGGQGLNMSYA
jgi:hypothetical protein